MMAFCQPLYLGVHIVSFSLFFRLNLSISRNSEPAIQKDAFYITLQYCFLALQEQLQTTATNKCSFIFDSSSLLLLYFPRMRFLAELQQSRCLQGSSRKAAPNGPQKVLKGQGKGNEESMLEQI